MSALQSLEVFCGKYNDCVLFIYFFICSFLGLFFFQHSELKSITLKSLVQKKKKKNDQFCRGILEQPSSRFTVLIIVSVSLQEQCFSLVEFLLIMLNPNFMVDLGTILHTGL